MPFASFEPVPSQSLVLLPLLLEVRLALRKVLARILAEEGQPFALLLLAELSLAQEELGFLCSLPPSTIGTLHSHPGNTTCQIFGLGSTQTCYPLVCCPEKRSYFVDWQIQCFPDPGILHFGKKISLGLFVPASGSLLLLLTCSARPFAGLRC